MLTSEEILGQTGRIAARLTHYEHRPQQLRMAEAVSDAIAQGGHLVVEAGTGVGKSFAYLVPAILAVTDEDEEGRFRPKRILVSTHTISLQEQLLLKDLPFLNSVIPREFTSVLVKGRGNYVSLRRLHLAAQRARNLFFADEDLKQVADLVAWSKLTPDGSLTDLGFRPKGFIWDEAASDTNNCLGRKCDFYQQCFYYRARRRIHNAQILVVNHALFLSDLALRREEISILPDYDVVILDEAHTLEAVAADHLGIGVTSGQVEYTLNKLYNPQTNRGLLVHHRLTEAAQVVEDCLHLSDEFFQEIYDRVRQAGGTVRTRAPGFVSNRLSSELKKLSRLIRDGRKGLEDEGQKKDFQSAELRLVALASEIAGWLDHALADTVYWAEAKTTRRGRPSVRLAAAPVDVGSQLREHLFDKTRTVILTSATLAVGREGSFDFFKSRVGLTQANTLQLGSPFNYREQAKIVLVSGMPDPTGDKKLYESSCVEMIQRYVARTDGRAFVLFTSYEMLRNAARQLTPWLAEQNLALIHPDEFGSRSKMLDAFRQNPRAVLLGTDGFWQGVDVPGEALQNVIITKLPFSVPDQPLLQAKLEAIREAGGNPFRDYQLPEAVIKLRQGFGRLIRTQRDRGIVVILDPRVHTKMYGRTFLDSLPNCECVTEPR